MPRIFPRPLPPTPRFRLKGKQPLPGLSCHVLVSLHVLLVLMSMVMSHCTGPDAARDGAPHAPRASRPTSKVCLLLCSISMLYVACDASLACVHTLLVLCALVHVRVCNVKGCDGNAEGQDSQDTGKEEEPREEEAEEEADGSF